MLSTISRPDGFLITIVVVVTLFWVDNLHNILTRLMTLPSVDGNRLVTVASSPGQFFWRTEITEAIALSAVVVLPAIAKNFPAWPLVKEKLMVFSRPGFDGVI